jgi:hypothetical protein
MTTLDDEGAKAEEAALTASSIPMRCQWKCFFIKNSSPIRLFGSDNYSTLLGSVPPVCSSQFADRCSRLGTEEVSIRIRPADYNQGLLTVAVIAWHCGWDIGRS